MGGDLTITEWNWMCGCKTEVESKHIKCDDYDKLNRLLDEFAMMVHGQKPFPMENLEKKYGVK